MDHLQLTHTLADAFNALADEGQLLADRKTVLEHKLRFAHEQFQYLADKYAPATPEIAETLARLQLPPHTSVDDTSSVPLPQRSTPQSQHHIALVIRDGRRVAAQLVSLGESSKTTGSSRETLSRTTSRDQTSMSTALEQDFTVEGKKGNLKCPFSKPVGDDDGDADGVAAHGQVPGQTPYDSGDPICAAMYEESTSQPAPSGTAASKCPIGFMDKHSPEEIALYVETHKHELPRSHEVCLRRYQKDEDQIKKLDSKYGNMVSMIEGLSQLHQRMLSDEEEQQPQRRGDADRASNERVENWAHAVSGTADSDASREPAEEDDGERQSHFDRPLKEIRVGESPSRPWGISVPVYEPSGQEHEHPLSPPPAPVRMPSPDQGMQMPANGFGKCPFNHTKLAALKTLALSAQPEPKSCPAPHAPDDTPFTPGKETIPPSSPTMPRPAHIDPSASKEDLPFTPVKETMFPSSPLSRPAFINPNASEEGKGSVPQMVFTGPVFIGYPMDQAIQFLNQYRGNQ
ncbi:hypothetical protein TOPH_00392 [Tolypocladium ophioglossoides CBS 100239]|uniref:Uncharacterized protein n=1 Tax=Tolypocladium ophioglossoides (strain CBS 100239) TaxID=1163406 RepID=A0A0L0NL79_TOLOC|nr:hypothetical protein TOPH_00392 [Tolypocladium ophioglossoides CBS 100239]